MARRRKPDPIAAHVAELNGIIAAISGPIRTQQPDVATRLNLVPVIFANGADDDLPGLVAAIENRPVLFGEHIYEPGQPLIIERRQLRISAPLVVIGSNGERLPGDWVEVRWPACGRTIILPGPIACDRSAEP